MRVDEFDFDLPEELIALRPARPRHASRLLHVGEERADLQFTDLPSLLKAGDLLVLNNTRVLPAALKGMRPARATGGGGAVEIDINLHTAIAPAENGQIRWKAFARPAKRVKEGDTLSFGGGLEATAIKRDNAEVLLLFNQTEETFNSALQQAGTMPLPPYIGRQRTVDAQDDEDYQTVFAKEQGSVAAPTAGLHFSPEIFERLAAKGVDTAEVTLHVGAGTFLPVSVEDTKDHKMHAEWGEVNKAVADKINATKKAGGNVICVGTTSLRLIESAARKAGGVAPFCDETDIFITPGYRFKIVDALITNFHLPRSTLFMLVSALAGQERMKAAYLHAIAHQYRFYSYGDACYLERYDK